MEFLIMIPFSFWDLSPSHMTPKSFLNGYVFLKYLCGLPESHQGMFNKKTGTGLGDAP